MGMVQGYSEKMASTIKQGAFVMYPLQPVLLNFSVEFTESHTFNGHALVDFPAFAYEDYITIQIIEEQQGNRNLTSSVTPELEASEKISLHRKQLLNVMG